MTAIDIRAGDLALCYEADAGGRLRQIGFRVLAGGEAGPERGPFPAEAFPLAYPAWGESSGGPAALRMDSHEGRPGTYLTLAGYEHAGSEHRVTLADEQAAVEVTLCLRAWPAERVLEQWTEIRHSQPGPVTLHEAAAAAPAVHMADPWLVSYCGDWASEWQPATRPIELGSTVVRSFGAVRPHLQAAPFFLLSSGGRPAETSGSVLAGALAWGGGIRLAFEREPRQPAVTRIRCGHNPAQGGYRLDAGLTFRTPRMIWAWSDAGCAPLTTRLHRWIRAHALRDGDRVRPIVFNTWEAAYFGFDAARLSAMMTSASDLGAELFLLDDGWFGTQFPRNDDTAGLGDWEPDPAKLPDGIGGLTAAARSRGLDFGLWIEPEMVNPSSELYARHADWVTAVPGRPGRLERNQLVLDLCQPPVREFAAGVIDGLLSANPGISYLKWDANRDISEPGSTALAADRQSNVWIDTVLARWQVMSEVASRWPDTTIMLCASGGGRTDLGTLRWFHEVWLSDNTDASARLRMQWEASKFLPPMTIGAHVTRWGDQDLAFACAVALSARFGFDLDPATLTPAEAAACREAAALYREIRDLVQFGELIRLIPPDEDRAALAYADQHCRRIAVLGYQLADAPPGHGSPAPAVARPAAASGLSCPVAGVLPAASYQVRRIRLAAEDTDLGTSTGARLLADGLAWPLRSARTAVIWLLTGQAD